MSDTEKQSTPKQEDKENTRVSEQQATSVGADSLNDPDATVPIDDENDWGVDDDAESPASPATRKRRHHTSEIFASHGGVKVSWRHVSYTVQMNDEGKTQRQILDNISGTALPGRVLCILGPSGAGKTTFLNTIGGRLIMAEESKLEGGVYLNDVVLTEDHKPIVSFVCQDDIVMPKETPIDAFRFSSSIRNQNLTSEEVDERAENMIKDLKLTSCRDTVMGVPGLIKGLSGGEKRRCNIGVELINNPPVIFLDEPTSGLDSVAAYRIGKLLRSLAHVDGRTVICTVHSPSSELFALFDDLLLLGEGKVVYHGPVTGVKEYFTSIGFPPPDRINPAEFAMYLLQSAPEELRQYTDCWNRCGEKLVPGYMQHLPETNMDGSPIVMPAEEESAAAAEKKKKKIEEEGEEELTERQSSFKEQDPVFLSKFGDRIKQNLALPPATIRDDNAVVSAMMKERKPASFFHQFLLVSGRSWRNVIRDPMLTFARVGQTIVFALFIGLVYLNLTNDNAGVQDRQGLLFLFMIQNTFLALMPGLMAFPPELAVFLQDMSNGLYNPGIFYWVKAIVELPLNTLVPTLFTIIIYFMAGLGGTAEQFFRFYCIALLTAFNSRAMGMLIGAFMGRSPEAAFVVAPLAVMPQAFVAGLFANTDRLEPGWVWLEWISFCRYAFKSMMLIEFEGIGTLCTPGPKCRFPTGADVIRYMGFDQYEMDKFGYSVLWLCMIMLVFSGLGTVAMFYQSAKQRVKLQFAENHKKMQKIEDEMGAREADTSAAEIAPAAPSTESPEAASASQE